MKKRRFEDSMILYSLLTKYQTIHFVETQHQVHIGLNINGIADDDNNDEV